MSTSDTNATVDELYVRVKAATDKFFTTLRQARDNESQGSINIVSNCIHYYTSSQGRLRGGGGGNWLPPFTKNGLRDIFSTYRTYELWLLYE